MRESAPITSYHPEASDNIGQLFQVDELRWRKLSKLKGVNRHALERAGGKRLICLESEIQRKLGDRPLLSKYGEK